VGVDVVQCIDVQHSIERFGRRYMDRLFTEHEIETCRAEPTAMAPRLAARFAAKEATIKVIRPAGGEALWRSIEVVRHEHGHCELRLLDDAARLAEREGVSDLSVSLTHEGDIAAAVVIGICDRADVDWSNPS
jgi:holo-[acyl-carrier protein] synthase